MSICPSIHMNHVAAVCCKSLQLFFSVSLELLCGWSHCVSSFCCLIDTMEARGHEPCDLLCLSGLFNDASACWHHCDCRMNVNVNLLNASHAALIIHELIKHSSIPWSESSPGKWTPEAGGSIPPPALWTLTCRGKSFVLIKWMTSCHVSCSETVRRSMTVTVCDWWTLTLTSCSIMAPEGANKDKKIICIDKNVNIDCVE